MKNVMVIDAALNCAYSVYQTTDEDFALIFPGEGQDIEFIDDFFERSGDEKAARILNAMWPRRMHKPDIVGLHGTLFYEQNFKKKFYPHKKESDMDQAFKP